ncbi:MAG: hypothetical protein EXS13_04010 [Planctomycetes bacterium]|nr:hypothetical protein [Planctomycetota bacterium]
MPLAIKMQEEYGDDVQFMFVSNGEKPEEIEQFGLKKGWFSDHAIWSSEAPFQTGATTIPHCVVLGIDGSVLVNANPMSAHSEIEQVLAEQLKLAKKGPKDLSPALSKAWADFEKGMYAGAIKALEATPEGAPDKQGADDLAKKLAVRAKAKLNRLSWLIEAAEFEQADKLAAQLAKGLTGHELAEKLNELTASLTAKEMAPEREAAKALEKVEKRIVKDGIDAAALKQLKSVGEKFAQTRAGKRASRMAGMLGA